MRCFFRLIVMILSIFFVKVSCADLIKDMTTIQGVRYNQLLGYGLVVGLTNSGDRSAYTDQSLKILLSKYSINIPTNTRVNANNVAAVMVEAVLPAFAKTGQTIDVTVSSIGNAKSLRNGTLITTPLRGVDGNVYAIAQGNLVVSGIKARGSNGSKIIVNSTNVGSISNGATVERIVPNDFQHSEKLVLNLQRPDFTTSDNIAKAINKSFGTNIAVPVDSASVNVTAPKEPEKKVAFVSKINLINVVPGQPKAQVVVDSRTGTVVMNNKIRVLPVAISEGNLVVNISESSDVYQPNPFSLGQTEVVERSKPNIQKKRSNLKVLKSGPSLNAVVHALNTIGASTSDLIQILQLLKNVGALKAELIIK